MKDTPDLEGHTSMPKEGEVGYEYRQNVNEGSEIPSARIFRQNLVRTYLNFMVMFYAIMPLDKPLWKPNAFRQTSKTNIT